MDREGWYYRVLYGTESDDFKLLSGGRADRHRFKVGGSQILVCVWLIDIYVLYSKAEKKSMSVCLTICVASCILPLKVVVSW